MKICESKLPIIPIEDSKHYSCSEENDTINLENNSNDINSYQNFLIGSSPNNATEKRRDKNMHSLIKKEKGTNKMNSKVGSNVGSNTYGNIGTNVRSTIRSNNDIGLNLIKRKKGVMRKDPYGSTHLVLGNLKSGRKLKRKLLWNNYYGDQNTNVSELSYIKDFENNSFMHDNNHHMILYENKYRDYNAINNRESRSEKIRNFFVYSPDIIQRWLRVIFNIIITSLIVTLIYFIFVSVREDINKKVAIQVQNVKEESDSCKKQYYAHKCGKVNLPILNEKCEEWLKCMKTDHKLYQDVSFLSAQMLGQIINAFIVQFEWKSICVIAFIFLLIFIGSNYALSIGGGGTRSSANEYNIYNPYMNNHHLPNNNIPLFPYYNYYPFIPQAVNYNSSSNNADPPMMNIPFTQNKFYQNGSFSRPIPPSNYNYFNHYMNNNENNASTQSTSRNKDYSDAYSTSKDDTKRGSQKLGFLKYLTPGFK
ncbi:nucleus export protein BRR6 [Plasmodium gonderi]|uniref:Nucleus export protein BRR6 n=1 Tax=Plasmodium gonderi TaxID=77519 RepID=A0A1Y1JQ33_PLAGO|nr:nucleus export protein BRR6 [Plasmodium gonderi]GAW83608.1 nucleus export protein BRR6 [Plasmodium gonderi]